MELNNKSLRLKSRNSNRRNWKYSKQIDSIHYMQHEFLEETVKINTIMQIGSKDTSTLTQNIKFTTNPKPLTSEDPESVYKNADKIEYIDQLSNLNADRSCSPPI